MKAFFKKYWIDFAVFFVFLCLVLIGLNFKLIIVSWIGTIGLNLYSITTAINNISKILFAMINESRYSFLNYFFLLLNILLLGGTTFLLTEWIKDVQKYFDLTV